MWNLLEFEHNTALVNEKGESCTYTQLYEESRELARNIGGRCLVALLEQHRFCSGLCDFPQSPDSAPYA